MSKLTTHYSLCFGHRFLPMDSVLLIIVAFCIASLMFHLPFIKTQLETVLSKIQNLREKKWSMSQPKAIELITLWSDKVKISTILLQIALCVVLRFNSLEKEDFHLKTIYKWNGILICCCFGINFIIQFLYFIWMVVYSRSKAHRSKHSFKKFVNKNLMSQFSMIANKILVMIMVLLNGIYFAIELLQKSETGQYLLQKWKWLRGEKFCVLVAENRLLFCILYLHILTFVSSFQVFTLPTATKF